MFSSVLIDCVYRFCYLFLMFPPFLCMCVCVCEMRSYMCVCLHM
uniref:Uncharacterized protein n=1 Tax=Mus musculus TaxID=10090 RepID=Q8R3Y9_MOUSE|nr:Unknown (protein for MGC:27981) [Mus musculus]